MVKDVYLYSENKLNIGKFHFISSGNKNKTETQVTYRNSDKNKTMRHNKQVAWKMFWPLGK